MKVLCIGDVVGAAGRDCLARHLSSLKRQYQPDIIIVNGENAADGNGIDRRSMDEIFDSGADVITGGNHSLQKKTAGEVLEDTARLLRPANLGNTFGHGICRIEGSRRDALIINLQGNLYLPESENAFVCLERILQSEVTDRDIVIVDFHAEATSEKQALGYFADGKVSLLFGTHTHVPTADETILENGTGYISDIGMTGVRRSVLGKDVDVCVHNFYAPGDRLPIRDAEGESTLCGIYCEIDDNDKKCTKIERIIKK